MGTAEKFLRTEEDKSRKQETRTTSLCTTLVNKKGLETVISGNSEKHVPDFDYDIHSDSDSPTASNEKVSTGPDDTLQHDFKSNKYQLPPLLSNRPTVEFILPIPFECSLACLKKQNKMQDKVNDIFKLPGLGCQTDENFGNLD